MTKKSYVKSLVTLIALACVVIISCALSLGQVFADEAGPIDITGDVDYGIPVVYISIDETAGPTIDEMNTSPDHSVTCVGTMKIDAPDGFRYSDMPNTEIVDTGELSMSIRGRGNSTWSRYPKRPYKIKLDSKADMFGLGENKHWVLVANYYDHTLVKDRITAWLGDKMGFEFTPMGVPVDVVMTGSKYGRKYLGSYYFSENVRVDKNRLNIEELKETDDTLPKISGGYLVQNSLQVRQGSPDRFITKHGVGWATHTPSFDTEADSHSLTETSGNEGEPSNEELYNDPDPVGAGENVLGDAYENHAQQDYIQEYIQKVEDALFEGGTGYRDMMDLESAAKYYLVQEFSLNRDSYGTGSTYIYKKRNDDKIYWGPLWDFDFAWYYEETFEEYNIKHEWLEPMFCDTGDGGFVKEIEKQWAVMKPALEELAKNGGVLDGYKNETKASAYADQAIWRPDEEDFSYETEIEGLKKWINSRIKWTDDNISFFENVMHRVQFTADGKIFDNKFVMDGASVMLPDEVPEKDGYFFLGWKDENGNAVDSMTKVTNDMTVTADFVPDSQVTKAEDIAFQKSSDIQKRNHFVSGYTIKYTVIPEDAQDKRVEWSSSDESFATVDKNGVVSYVDKGTGLKTVTITAKLKNGKTREFRLSLTDDDLPKPVSISPENEKIEMTIGGQAAFTIKTDPDPASIDDYTYVSDNESIVKVDPSDGVITAVGAGQTKVHVTVTTGDTECETFTTVTVAEPESKDLIAFREMVGALPAEITADNAEKVHAEAEAARAAYNALSDEDKKKAALDEARLSITEAKLTAVDAVIAADKADNEAAQAKTDAETAIEEIKALENQIKALEESLREAIAALQPKEANTLTVKGKTVKIKAKTVRKKTVKVKRSKAVTVNRAQGKVTYKLSKVTRTKFKKYFKVAGKTGKIAIKKGLKKGRYVLKIKVTAAGNASCEKGSKTAKVTVMVK